MVPTAVFSMSFASVVRPRPLVLFALALILSGCAVLRRELGPDTLTDGNIAAMFLAENNTDISYAKIAIDSARTPNQAVVAYALRMLNDHGGLNKDALDLFGSAGITPRDNVASLEFRDESASVRDMLRERRGAAFDSTYMGNETRYQARMLELLDHVMIPNARDARLKGMLTSARAAISAHLEHAQRVYAGLGK